MDDTAYTLRCLRILGVPPEDEAMRLGLQWVYRLQNSDGSWPTFVRNSKVPFDRGCPYITGQVLSALAVLGEGKSEPAQKALSYLREHQHSDGSFDSLCFRVHTRGTSMVVEALADLGLADDAMTRRAAGWLRDHQNDDGGWGNGRGAGSTAEETAWSVSSLLNLDPEGYREEIEGGIGWLLDHQRADGGWDAGLVGMYFSTVIYSNAFYALSYPLIALSRYRKSKLTA